MMLLFCRVPSLYPASSVTHRCLPCRAVVQVRRRRGDGGYPRDDEAPLTPNPHRSSHGTGGLTSYASASDAQKLKLRRMLNLVFAVTVHNAPGRGTDSTVVGLCLPRVSA